MRRASAAASLLDVENLPDPIAEIVRSAYGDATGTIFMVAAGVAVLSLVASLLMKEVPLRTTLSKKD